MDLRLILVLCALTATRAASQSDIQTGQCAKHCKASDLNEYPLGQTHVYKYSARTTVKEWETLIDVMGEALLTRLSTCDYSLELREINISGFPNADQLKNQLMARSLRFAWVDGEITDVCHDPEDEEWAVNIKKAILSSLQVVSTSGYLNKVERDILGDCPTEYNLDMVSSDKISIIKRKDTFWCGYRTEEKILNTLQNLMAKEKPTYECRQVWTSQYILKSLTCTHLAVEAGANLHLDYVRTESKSLAKPLESFYRGQLIAYRPMPKRTLPESTNLLSNLCQSISNQIESHSPQVFRDFTHSLETLEYNDLKKMWNSLIEGNIHESCTERAKIMFVDALLHSRTGPALKLLVKDLYQGKYISEMKLKAAIYSLIYRAEPCSETMEAITELLRGDRPLTQTLFGMTAAIQKYYEISHDKHIASAALDLVIARLHQAKEDEKVVVVRALSNIRFDAEKLIKAFDKYFESGKPELKVAIIEALNLVDSCHEAVYGRLRKLVLSTSQPNEVRVRALKVYLRCADESAVSQLKSHIETRTEDTHFNSYADSYLRNALTTMNPDKQVIKETAALGQSSWKAPKVTLARNIEFSSMDAQRNFGFNYELDSIVENDREVPTWVILNSSIPFKHVNALNFEIGLRQEGMEKLASKLMNQMNQINGKEWERIIKEAVERRDYQPIVHELTKVVREIEKLAKKNAQFSAYIKINGVTLFYLNSAASKFDHKETLQRLMVENTEARKVLDTTLGWIFADFKINTPMVTGLTWQYKHEGTIIPGLKAALKSQSTSEEKKFTFAPNFAYEFNYGHQLVLREPVASQINRMNINSEIVLEGIHKVVKTRAGSIHKLILNTVDEIDLLRFEISRNTAADSKVVIKKNNSGLKSMGCSTEYTEKLFGFAICFEGHEEDLDSFMKTKNDIRIVRRLVAKKTDKSIKTYEMTLRMEEGIRGITLDTPNSNVNRKVELTLGKSGNLKMDKNFSGKFWVSLVSPVKAIDVNVSAAFPSGREWIVSLDSKVDRQLHAARLTLAPKSNKQHIANLMVNSPLLREKIDYDLTFTSPYEAGNEIMAQLHSNRMNNKRSRLALIKLIHSQQDSNKLAKLELELNNEQNEKIIYSLIQGSVKGSFPAINAVQYSGKVEYRRRQGKMETIELNGNHKVDTTGEAKAVSNNWELKTSQYPHVNGKVAHKMFLKPAEHLENEIEFRWGRDYNQDSTLNKFNFRQVSSKKTDGNNNYEIKNSIIAENRAQQFNHKVEGKIVRSQELFKLELVHSDLNRPENNHKLVIDHKTPGEKEGTLNLAATSSRGSRSVKATYSLNKPLLKITTIYKAEPVGKSVRGYHVEASLNRLGGGKQVVHFELLNHPANKQIFKADMELTQERSKALGNFKISFEDMTLLHGEYERNADQIKTKLTSPRIGSLDVSVDRRMKSVRVLTKDNKEWTHEFVAGIGQIKQIKSTTISGIAVVPALDVTYNPINKSIKLALRTTKSDFHANLDNYDDEPVFRAEFNCAEHRDSHKTEAKWTRDSKLITSEHSAKGEKVYTVEMRSDKKNNERTHKLILKAGSMEARLQNIYKPETSLNKFDLLVKANNLEGKLNSEIAFPAQRARFARRSNSMEIPKVDIKASIKVNDKESSLVINNNQITKVHVQHRNKNGIPLVLDTKFDSKKWTIVGNVDQLKLNFIVLPEARSVDLTLDGYGKLAKLELTLNKKGDAWTVTGSSKVAISGEDQFDGKIQGELNENLITGPHSINIKNFEDQIEMTYRLENDKLALTLKSIVDGQKLIEANFNGDKFGRGRVFNLNGKLELDSTQIEALKKIVYEVKYNRDGRKVDLSVEKKGSVPMNLKLSANIALEAATVNAEINGRTVEGKQRKLVIDYNRSNKIEFSAKLFDASKVESEMGASIPLVRIAEFIGNEANFFLKSKNMNSEATFSLKAPTQTSITGLININIRGNQWFRYNLIVNDGSSNTFFGTEKVDLVNPIAILNDVQFRGKPVYIYQHLVSQGAISVKSEIPNLYKVNYAFFPHEKTPQVLAKFCFKDSCSKMTSRLTLGQKGLADMSFEGPKGEQQKYDVHFKWNQEQGNEYGSVLLVKDQRKYGYEVSRIVKSNNAAVYETKIHLPKRVMAITLTKDIDSSTDEKFMGTYVVMITPKENAEPLKITLDRSVKRSATNFKADNTFTLEHKSLAKPILLFTSVAYVKSDAPRYTLWGIKSADISTGLNYEGETIHDLNGALHFEMVEEKLNYNWRVWQKEEKIDFGCKGAFASPSQKIAESLKDYTCHWVDRNGQRKEIKREQKIQLVRPTLNKILKINFSDNMKNPLGSLYYNGSFHFAEAIKNAVVDFHTEDGSRYSVKAKIETDRDEKCFEMTFFEAATEGEKYGLRSCLNLKARSGKPVFSFEMITFGNKVNMAEGERKVTFTIKRMKEFVNDYLISLIWDTNSVAQAAVGAIDVVESIGQKRTAMITERDAELKAKMDYIRSSVGEKINKVREHMNNEVGDLTKEMEHERKMFEWIQGKLASRSGRYQRSLSKKHFGSRKNQPDFTSPMTYEWKEYDIENGRLELILRSVEAQKVPRFIYELLEKESLI